MCGHAAQRVNELGHIAVGRRCRIRMFHAAILCLGRLSARTRRRTGCTVTAPVRDLMLAAAVPHCTAGTHFRRGRTICLRAQVAARPRLHGPNEKKRKGERKKKKKKKSIL
jgi:hypothetical protein